MTTEITLIGANSPNKEKIKEEFKEIQEVIGENNSSFNIKKREDNKLRKDFALLIQNAKSEIIHISAEGKEEDGSIVFILDDNGDRKEELDPDHLAELFKHKDVNYVVLNFCYSKKAAELIANHVQCAIGINGFIREESTIAFSKNFYFSLKDENQPLNQESIDTAFSKGEAAVMATEKVGEKYIKILGRKPQPEMQILKPTEGSTVLYPCKCKGLFNNLPQGATMWAYVNATIEGKFYLVEIRNYPNGKTNGEWNEDLYIGPPEGDNDNYRIGVLIVDPETTKELKSQREEAFTKFKDRSKAYFALDSLPNRGTQGFDERAVKRQ